MGDVGSGSLGILFVGLATFALRWLLVVVWIVWWLFAVDWRKAWPVLARGAWMAVLLLVVTAALVWSRLTPSEPDWPSFWWHLLWVGALTAVALVCGWLQGVMGWEPAEVELDAGEKRHDSAPRQRRQHGHLVAFGQRSVERGVGQIDRA